MGHRSPFVSEMMLIKHSINGGISMNGVRLLGNYGRGSCGYEPGAANLIGGGRQRLIAGVLPEGGKKVFNDLGVRMIL